MSTPIEFCLIEDDARLRESIASYLDGTDGLVCTGTFATGEEAVAGVPALRPKVVLVDINLPGISGIECVRALKAKLPSLLAVMLTVYENTDRIFEALEAGACGYLLKSTPPERLIEAIEEVCEGGSPMSGHIARKVVQAFQRPLATPRLAQLAPREQQVLTLLSEGSSYKQIAADMDLSIGTVRTYIRRMYEKLQVNCRTDAVVLYLDATGTTPRRPPG